MVYKTLDEMKRENAKLRAEQEVREDMRKRNLERKEALGEMKKLKEGRFSKGIKRFGRTLSTGAKYSAKQIIKSQKKKRSGRKRTVRKTSNKGYSMNDLI